MIIIVMAFCLFDILFNYCYCCNSCSASSSVTEFCHTELFQPTCAADEVVTIESAQYGRLNIGMCYHISTLLLVHVFNQRYSMASGTVHTNT